MMKSVPYRLQVTRVRVSSGTIALTILLSCDGTVAVEQEAANFLDPEVPSVRQLVRVWER
jgi:hypothetical protein